MKQSEAERTAATVTESEVNGKTRVRRSQTMREVGARRATNSVRIRENKPVREADFKTKSFMSVECRLLDFRKIGNVNIAQSPVSKVACSLHTTKIKISF